MKKNYDLSKMRRVPGPVEVYPEAATTAISIRLDTMVLCDIKDEADRMGLPYQTLINSILHRFVTGQLVDKGKKSGAK
jgi:uncharacterized protein (DUF4415 family)